MRKMQTETQIREEIAKLRKAIDADGYKPVTDGKNLKEHLYYLRLGSIQALEDVVGTQEEIDNWENREQYGIEW
jgi:hypothetical protein